MSYKIMYPQIPNMGDLLNKDMLEELFNIKVIRKDFKNCNLIAIGSALDQIMYSKVPKVRFKQTIGHLVNNNVHIWSTGFIRSDPKMDLGIIYKNIHIHALRGKLTLKRMENVLGKKLDVPTGDGGLLAERWIGYYPDKLYHVGIIPHFKEQDHHVVKKLLESYENTTLIDLTQNPKDVVKKIGQCEYVISSSLHGMIVADSFHIPNIHITLTNNMFGDGNKYHDYLSAFDVTHTPFDCSKGVLPSIQDIKNNYKIDEQLVEQKKEQLIKAFPIL